MRHGGYLGLAWAVAAHGSLVLKLYPDVALFYGALYLFALLALLGNACAPLRAALSGQPRCVRPVLRFLSRCLNGWLPCCGCCDPECCASCCADGNRNRSKSSSEKGGLGGGALPLEPPPSSSKKPVHRKLGG